MGILFRAGFDFMKTDQLRYTAWDRSVSNWSLFCMNFMVDMSSRKFKTNLFLTGGNRYVQYELVPETPLKAHSDLASKYFPSKLSYFNNARSGFYDSLFGVLIQKPLEIVNYIKFNWDKGNIANIYWLRVYFFTAICILLHLITLALIWDSEPQNMAADQ